MIKKQHGEKEKGFSKINELKKKIKDEHYIHHAIDKMASEICEAFLDQRT